MFSLLDVGGETWGHVTLFSSFSYTEYEVRLGPVYFYKPIKAVFFPFQWSSACLSLDSIASKVRVVVDGQLLGEEEYKREEKRYMSAKFSLHLGYGSMIYEESRIKIANLNVFNSSLSLERMIRMTRAGEEECGAPGDLVSWETAEWTLHSQAKLIGVKSPGLHG